MSEDYRDSPDFTDVAPRSSLARVLAASLIGMSGAVIIWIVAPYNTFVLFANLQDLAGSYVPVVVLFLTLALVLVVNPLLRWARPRFALTPSQLALIVGIMLMACVVPTQGLLGLLPYSLAKTTREVRVNKPLADVWEQMNLPPGLFPDSVGYGKQTPASDAFITELRDGQSIPWGAWTGPLLYWGTFMLFAWFMMVGLAMIVLPQWQRNERLPFPLVTVQQSLIEAPEKGTLFAPMFRSRGLWIAAIGVFVVHLMAGAKVYNPEAAPAVPLSWNLGRLFTEEPLRHLPWHIKSGRIYIIYLGLAFFMPTRISFSIWFFEIAYGLYTVICTSYFPPYHGETIREHNTGAAFALTISILWLGRAHWARVGRCMITRPAGEEDRRNRQAGYMFTVGWVGMVAWLCWMGVPWPWSIAFVAVGFMVCLLITRVFAETGMPFMRISCLYPSMMIKMAPVSWLTPAALFFATVITTLFNIASRMSGTTMAAQSLALDQAGSPRQQGRTAWGLLGVLLVGLVLCGAVHLYMNYHNSTTLDGRDQPIAEWGTRRFTPAYKDLVAWQLGTLNAPAYNQPAHIAFGAGLAAALQWACLHMPRWPLHPIGLLLVASWYTGMAWPTIFVGWMLKVLILRFGGARVYRAARPIFLGLIVGDVFAASFWALVPLAMVGLGQSYHHVNVLP